MKRALVVTTVSGTIKAFLIPQIELLKKQGFEVDVATNITGKIEEFSNLLDGVKIHDVPFNRNAKSLENVRAYRIIKGIIRDGEYDLIHVHTPIAAFLTRLASTRRNKVIYTAHGFHFNENGSNISNLIYKTMEKIAAKKTDRLIVINQDDYETGKSIISSKRLRYIKGVGVDVQKYNQDVLNEDEKMEFKQSLGIEKNKKVITHIAELNGNKRQIDAVLAAGKFKEIYGDNFVLLLVGRGPMLKSIQDEIKNLELDKYIKCLGFRNDISKILSITDVGMLISLREGLPKSVMEMMSMKIPVVATNIRGNRDLIKNKENGILVDIKKPNQIAEAWNEIFSNPNMRRRFIEKSYDKICKEYSLEIILSDLEKLYEEMI
ncbi:glycosyltransferase involved in cell wall biosynthesis [Bacillus sp. AG1163]|uniref:glycosyltransferase family 4 protein n=1 Tax=Bacillus sp. AG1163 TaxID=2183999 RepID=UPI001064FAD8|nr:glycosyltransferase family 4 protein [Bacillus sp. AG1163]TDT79871.1 glycosyltransferase involved in cell wall biosynthesis [Bacillus sp. AG1163]